VAKTYGFFNSVSGDRTYNADDMSEYFEGLISDGVYENVGGALQVYAGSGRTLKVQTGRAILANKWFKSDAVEDITIPTLHGTLNCWVAVRVRLDVENREIILDYVAGTPATYPEKPEPVRSDAYFDLFLAYVYVAAGSGNISQSNITDCRADNAVCGWVTGVVDQVNTATLFLQWQNAYQNFYNSFVSWFDTLTSQLQVNTYLKKYEKTVMVADIGETEIPLDMLGYTYEDSDVLLVYLNGLHAAKGTDYTVVTTPVPAIKVNFTYSSPNKVDVVAIKSKIGDPVSGEPEINAETTFDITIGEA
jgi:hypothetical protein